MARYVLVTVLLATLLMVSAPASVADLSGDRSIPVEIIGGDTWTNDIRITRNFADDTLPLIVMDDAGNAHIMWQRSGLWTKTVDRTGSPLTKEIFITPNVVRGSGSPDRYPVGPQVDIDSNSNIHVVWDDGRDNVFYRKFDPDGNTLSGEIRVGNKDNITSQVPSIAVDPVNDYVHIVHEDYMYGSEDIVYSKLDNDGKILVNEVSVSSDVTSPTEHSTLTIDRNGYIHVVFGSPNGAWWRKVDNNGVARGNSVNIPSVPSYKIADLAVTPNGDVHMVWTVDGEVRYAQLDNNGTKLNEDVVVSDNGTSPGPPRIVAAHETNTVHIVWHDSRDGNAEIYYATMEEGSFNETPENLRLTNDTAASLYPRVAVGPGDSVHVVWEDTRDGNSEIYYKLNFKYRMMLAPVNVAELTYMYFWRPGETKALELYVENLGLLSDDIRVNLTYDDWAESVGWVIEVDETEFDGVLGGTKVYLNISMTAPQQAYSGDYINVSVKARSLNDKDVHDSLSWREFIIVEQAVTVQCAEATKQIPQGGDVRFNLTITNIGDVPDTYRIEHTLIPENGGWQAVQDIETVTLGEGESSNMSVLLSAPEEALANDNGTVFVRVQSMTDASVWDGKRLMGTIDPSIQLMMEVLTPSKWVEPADSVDFPITVRNVGNMQDRIAIDITSSVPRPGWSVDVSNGTVNLAGGEEQVITLAITAPANALAGSRQVIKVSSISEDNSSQASLEVSAVVYQTHWLSGTMSGEEVGVHAGEEGKFLFSITNEGNGNELVALNSALVPPGWNVTFEHDDEPVDNLMLLPKETKTVEAVVSTSTDAQAGWGSIVHIVLTDTAGGSYILPFSLKIFQKYAVDLSSPNAQGAGTPHGFVNYQLTIINEGNGQDIFALEHGDLPGTEWYASFHEEDWTDISYVTLAGGERRDIKMRVYIPVDPDLTGPVDISVRATSTSAAMDEVELTLSVLLPDLQILSVEYDPTKTTDVEPTEVTIQVSNNGSAPAENVNVVMFEDGREIDREVVSSLDVGSTVTVSFTWTPTKGKHTLTYRVSSEGHEADNENNELDHTIKVGGETPAQDGFGMWAVLMALVCLVVVARVRRRG